MSRIHNFCYKYFAVDLQSDVMSEEMYSIKKYLAQSQFYKNMDWNKFHSVFLPIFYVRK